MIYKGIIKKSRTLDAAAILALIAALEQNQHFIQLYAGQYFGAIMLGMVVLKVILRFKTTGAVGEK